MPSFTFTDTTLSTRPKRQTQRDRRRRSKKRILSTKAQQRRQLSIYEYDREPSIITGVLNAAPANEGSSRVRASGALIHPEPILVFFAGFSA